MNILVILVPCSLILGIGALLAGKVEPGDKTIVLLSGRNIDMELHRKIINHEDYQN